MLRFYRTAIFFLFILSCHTGWAQHGIYGSWNIVNLKLVLNKKWSLFGEFQLRSQMFYKNFSYYEVKGGASYNLKKNFSILAGGGRFITYSDGSNFKPPFVNKEWRIWEQFALNNFIDRIKLENRFRIEQRWTTSLGYRNRFKYRLQALVPVNHKKIVPGTFYMNGWDEAYFTDSNPHYEQNKIFGGIGYEISQKLTVQGGYLHQVNYKPDDTHSGKNYFQFSFLVEVNTHAEHHEKNSSGAD